MGKLVSIVIPVYNKSEFIRKCLDAVVNQTYDDIETIIVDDGSTDNSKDVIMDYLRDSGSFNAKFVTKQNCGMASARNCGMQYVSGEYVFYLDPDDILIENAIEILIKNSENADIVVGRYKYLFSDGSETTQIPSTILDLKWEDINIEEKYRYFGVRSMG